MAEEPKDEALRMMEDFARDAAKRGSNVKILEGDALHGERPPKEVEQIYDSDVCAMIKDGDRWKMVRGKATYDFLAAKYVGDKNLLPGLWIDTGYPIITKAYLKDIGLVYVETPSDMTLDEVENFVCDNLSDAFNEVIKPGTADSSEKESLAVIDRLLEEKLTENLLTEWDSDHVYAFARRNFYALRDDMEDYPYCEINDLADHLTDPTLLDGETAGELCAARIYKTVQTITREWETCGRKEDFFETEDGKFRMPPRKVEGDPLKFRPRTINEPIPSEVYEARLSRLPEDARYFLEKDFRENDKKHTDKYLYFGGLTQDSWGRNAALLAVRCADIAYGNEDMARNLFAGSGYGDNIKEENVAPLIHEAVAFWEKFGTEEKTMHDKNLNDLGVRLK